MREILFRGKCTDIGEWVEGYLIYNEFCNVGIPYIGYLDWEGHNVDEVIPETVGQYTGLTDKNGKKIFEGDICLNTKTKEVVSVGWHGTMAGYVWSKPRKDARLYDFGELFRAYDRYEVIGNIHDNPELLKGEQ